MRRSSGKERSSGRTFETPLDRSTTIHRIETIGALTHLVSSAEYLAHRSYMEKGGLGDWELLREKFQWLPKPIRVLLDVVSTPGVTRTIHGVRIIAASALLCNSNIRIRTGADYVLSISSALLHPRNHYGSDGADQVSFHTSTATAIARTARNEPEIVDAAISYVGLQSALSYLTSGTVKYLGSSWRDGSAVTDVMRTKTYGSEKLWRFFTSRPFLAKMAAHGMLLWESGFAVTLLTNPRISGLANIGTIGFHSIIAASMGLGRFLSAFGSMLPAVTYASSRPPIARKMLALTVGASVAVLGTGMVARLIRAANLAAEMGTATTLEASDGYNIPYKVWKSDVRGAPTIVLGHGLLASPDYFLPLVAALKGRYNLVTLWRRGYDRSQPGDAAANIDVNARDISELVYDLRAQGMTRIYLCGHSLGGLIARRVSEDTKNDITGVVLLDSTHPDQFQRTSVVDPADEPLAKNIRGVRRGIQLGFGWMIPRAEWARKLSKQDRTRLMRTLRDDRIWDAGAAEWHHTRTFFQSQNGPATLKHLNLPALVITAGATSSLNPRQLELHREICDKHAHAASMHLVIGNCTHEGLLTQDEAVNSVAEAITRFIANVEGEDYE